ncbi:hypothetical protein GX50_06572 [[Emmonsia] crescens]|uniref:Uncharacterized protein n=1 Tax=[Emmonsia] crescens TaxID=73230 RepID=A0A2B7ZBU7_9EURO|nr:hypothetical protein GX50_06572 [Emmonsia crescens]
MPEIIWSVIIINFGFWLHGSRREIRQSGKLENAYRRDEDYNINMQQVTSLIALIEYPPISKKLSSRPMDPTILNSDIQRSRSCTSLHEDHIEASIGP